MRRRIILFLSAVLLSLLVAPAVNILSAPDITAVKWQTKHLYNMDFASKSLSRILYPLGISIDPRQVTIGREGWLFLGDAYEQTLTLDRCAPTQAQWIAARRTDAALDALEAYLSRQGVKLFRIMVGPNKGTVYPEHLPGWARPSTADTTGTPFANVDAPRFVDLKGPLLTAKAEYDEPLYYMTDTHWNALGGALAFRSFARQLAPAAPELRWPSDTAYVVSGVEPRRGGDMARFLRLKESLHDSEPVLAAQDIPVETIQYDYNTGQVLRQGGNSVVHAVGQPLLVRSQGALNDRKVLWLRDSFGTAMSPLMAATFSEVVQVDWRAALRPGGPLAQIVEGWKPDYVFITIVERAFKHGDLVPEPQPTVLPRDKKFTALRTSAPLHANQLKKGPAADEYRINGLDPFIDFALADAVGAADVRYLGIDLTCGDGTTVVPLQVFWLKEGADYYDEEHSVRLKLPAGRQLLDLYSLPNWDATGVIQRIRIDVDVRDACERFTLRPPTLGVRPGR